MEDGPFSNKTIKKITIIASIAMIISGLIPSEDTCYKIIITSYITPNNIYAMQGEVTDLIDYIVDKASELKDKKKDN